MKSFETIDYTVSDRVATITLARPKTMNAISQKMRQELLAVIEAIENTSDIRVVVITAQGRGFSSGTDLTEGLAGFADIDQQIQTEYKPLLMAINHSDKIYISSVKGACAGIGCALALVCDFTVMADNAYLYIAFAAIGLIPDGGISYYLVRAMGYKKAFELFVESGKLTAVDCLNYGFANKVVCVDQLDAVTRAWAENIAKGAPIAQRLGKSAMKSAQKADLDEIIDIESNSQVVTTNSNDHINAVKSFFEKKESVFTGS